MPSVAAMNAYANEEYALGVYRSYVGARDIKYATFRARLDRLQFAVHPGARLLDVGCGCGYLIDVALERGLEAFGIEFSSAAIATASSSARARILNQDVNDLQAPGGGTFDLITAFDVLEHSLDPVALLARLHRLLGPNGTLVVTTPDTSHFLRPLLGKHWPMLQPLQHTVLFSRRSLSQALRRSGFESVRTMGAYKTLTADYLIDQLRIHLPTVTSMYDHIAGMAPQKLRQHPLSVNIGEVMALARKPALHVGN